MAVTNPKRSDLTAYAGNTFDFLYTFEDQNAAAIDLSADYNDIEFRIFQSGSKASPYVSLTVGSGLSITNTNELSGTITASQTDAAPSVLFYEIEFTLSDGSSEVYLFGRFFVNNFTGDGEKTAEFTITVNQNTNTVTFSESYDAAAKATQAKVDAEAAADKAANYTALEQVNSLGSISGVTEVDLSNGTVVQATLTGSVTLSFTGLPDSGTETSFTLVLSGAEAITYPSGTEFAGGSAPSITGPDYELPCSIDSAGNLTVYGVIDEIA